MPRTEPHVKFRMERWDGVVVGDIVRWEGVFWRVVDGYASPSLVIATLRRIGQKPRQVMKFPRGEAVEVLMIGDEKDEAEPGS